MNTYTPDRWIVLEFTTATSTIYKVFAGWHGGFTQGDSWKLNSGIVKLTETEDMFEFEGYSGSIYVCHKNSYGTTMYMESVLAGWESEKHSYNLEIRVLTLEEVSQTKYNSY